MPYQLPGLKRTKEREVESDKNTVGGRVLGWLQRVVVSLGELLGSKPEGAVDMLVNAGFEQLLEGYRQMVREAKMPCMIPAGYFAVLMHRVKTPHEADAHGMDIREEKKGQYESREEFRLASYGPEPSYSKEMTMHREVTVPSWPTTTKELDREFLILFTGDPEYVSTRAGQDSKVFGGLRSTDCWSPSAT